jgi:hypothetical protein
VAKLAILAVLWTVTLWRARAALKNPAKRPMWSAFAALAVSLTIELPQIGPHLDAALHVTNISTLIKHLAGMLAAASVLEWVIGSTQPTRRLGHILAWRHLMTGTAMAALGALFAFVPRIESSDFIDTAPGHPVTIAYEMVWLGYLGLAMLCASTMFAVAWHRSAGNGRVMQTSFALLTIGTALGVIYATWRVVVLAASLSGAATATQSDTGFGISNAIQDSAIVLILIGTCVPAAMKAIWFHQDRRDLIALRPLWELVIPYRPATVIDDEPQAEGDLRGRRLLSFRLIHRIIEIRDALGVLYEYCDLDPAPHVEAFANSIGLTGIDRDALVEAVTIRYAILSARTGSGGHAIVEPRRGGDNDLPGEIRWLRAVDRALNNHLRIQAALVPVLADRNEMMETT